VRKRTHEASARLIEFESSRANEWTVPVRNRKPQYIASLRAIRGGVANTLAFVGLRDKRLSDS
jgi:hypothetical protein